MKMNITIVMLLLYLFSFGQDSIVSKVKSNPVIFTEFYAGGAVTNKISWLLGYNLNYQFKHNNLLTARLQGIIGPSLDLPTEMDLNSDYSDERVIQGEVALLYGKRWINNNVSYSVSVGASAVAGNHYEKVGMYYESSSENYFGVPFEFNFKYFKAEKKIFKIYYGLVPVGKRKVSFARSVGLKLTGTLSKNSYVGLGITYGLGWHKKY